MYLLCKGYTSVSLKEIKDKPSADEVLKVNSNPYQATRRGRCREREAEGDRDTGQTAREGRLKDSRNVSDFKDNYSQQQEQVPKKSTKMRY